MVLDGLKFVMKNDVTRTKEKTFLYPNLTYEGFQKIRYFRTKAINSVFFLEDTGEPVFTIRQRGRGRWNHKTRVP